MLVERKRERAIPIRADRGQAIPSAAFEWAAVAFAGWLVTGAYLDSWAHIHNAGIETFFTPWHAVLYSGFLAAAGLLLGTAIRNQMMGYSWGRAIPVGYELALLGALIFVAGGVGDMLWHTILGIETDLDALFSPTHLTLALGGTLIASGPLRAAWRHRAGPGLDEVAPLPALLSLALLLSMLAVMTQFAHPWATALAAQSHDLPVADQAFDQQSLGVAGVLIQTAILMGLVLLAVQRWRLPFGGLTLVFGLSAVLMGLMRDQYYVVPVAIAAGLAADALVQLLNPSATRTPQLRLFAFAVPVILYALYFLALALMEGVWWSVHLWAGAIVVAGVAGWLVSFLIRPPETQQV